MPAVLGDSEYPLAKRSWSRQKSEGGFHHRCWVTTVENIVKICRSQQLVNVSLFQCCVFSLTLLFGFFLFHFYIGGKNTFCFQYKCVEYKLWWWIESEAYVDPSVSSTGCFGFCLFVWLVFCYFLPTGLLNLILLYFREFKHTYNKIWWYLSHILLLYLALHLLWHNFLYAWNLLKKRTIFLPPAAIKCQSS